MNLPRMCMKPMLSLLIAALIPLAQVVSWSSVAYGMEETTVTSSHVQASTTFNYTPNVIMTHDEFSSWFKKNLGFSLHSGKTRASSIIEQGDTIRINVLGEGELSGGDHVVGSKGMVSIPMVGEVYVKGKTLEALGTELEVLYAQYIVDPQVDILLPKKRLGTAYVVGAVREPGPVKLTLADNFNLLRNTIQFDNHLSTALSRAGGVLEDADVEHIHIYNATEGYHYEVNLYDLIAYGKVESDVDVQENDVVYLPRLGGQDAVDYDVMKLFANSLIGQKTFPIGVYGFVRNPGVINMPVNDMNLQAALAQSGGVNVDIAQPDKVYITRTLPDGKLKAIKIDSTKENVALLPHDIVVVSKTNIWRKLDRFLQVLNLVATPVSRAAFVIRNLHSVYGIGSVD